MNKPKSRSAREPTKPMQNRAVRERHKQKVQPFEMDMKDDRSKLQ